MDGATRLIAFYLPQFHPIPENDRWWGKGFTEWQNVVKAKPLFPGHYQPHLPADLGFYDLRVPETRQEQADLAQQYGIYGFCYYHYWFQGQRLLERPFEDVLASGKPDFPFCLCWANENWTRRWDGQEQEILMQQTYSEDDDRNHIKWLIQAFRDKRYIRINGKPIFLVYSAIKLPYPFKTAAIWREEAKKHGIEDIFLCKVESIHEPRNSPTSIGFDAAIEFQPDTLHLGLPLKRGKYWEILRKLRLSPTLYTTNPIYDYKIIVERMLQKPSPSYTRFPGVTVSWDSTPRYKNRAVIFDNSTPELYGKWLREVIRKYAPDHPEERLVFINAWNEWGEGNHLEPCQKWGRAYLEVTHQIMINETGGKE